MKPKDILHEEQKKFFARQKEYEDNNSVRDEDGIIIERAVMPHKGYNFSMSYDAFEAAMERYAKQKVGEYKLSLNSDEMELTYKREPKKSMMKALINKTGITIKELKELVKDLPEVDEYDGEDYEVWIENTDDQGLSNLAKTIMQLNKGDIIISHSVLI